MAQDMATISCEVGEIAEDHGKAGPSAVTGPASGGDVPHSIGVVKRILPAALGCFIEFYEFAIFSYLTEEITANFFAGHGGSLSTWAGFAMTFVFRPIGGAFFGSLADRFGRKPAMQLTLSFILFATLMQGLLPTFYCCGESWGWLGLALMLILRALQGLSCGGELTTAAVYITEISPRDRLGRNLMWVVPGAFGAWSFAGLVVFLCQKALDEEAMLRWGWRLPYLSTLVPGIIIFIARRYLEETPQFEDLAKAKVKHQAHLILECGSASNQAKAHKEKGPLLEVFANHKMSLLVGSLAAASMGSVDFCVAVYGPVLIRQQGHQIAPGTVSLGMMIKNLVPALLFPFTGMAIDRWGAGRMYGLATVLATLVPAAVLYWWAHCPASQAAASMLIGQFIIGLVSAVQISLYLWVVELFPVQVRVVGASVAYNIGLGIFGGMGPLICDAGGHLIAWDGLLSAPAAYNLVIGCLAVLACLGSRLLAKRGVMRVTHIREKPY
mmetsp:Transcript_1035/g.2649  ORF Transcript_1035/g.2649 Transcript_1035/m.2649 type:complete len:497 (-) Transcript_1035:443-1933(-)|eukprot:CAMPEP_0195055722 /NCGR_PEP_ID=MMETSP0448-20130528/4331_1 /TAXON_ID=66468 /ORGANISM="Heterocapsa triquestra, Strain CCMP 448" /LENGTH=496 /DNA_ID=CAMNT_0040085425 /DNA_START=89 /DNA_END=1579 /DNA_ORIENTATION=+